MFADKARAAGVDVSLEVWDGMIHVFQMFGGSFPRRVGQSHRSPDF